MKTIINNFIFIFFIFISIIFSSINISGAEVQIYHNFNLSFYCRKSFINWDVDYSLSLTVSQAWIKANPSGGWGYSFGWEIANRDEGQFKNPSDIINNKSYFGGSSTIVGKDLFELLGIITVFDQPFDLSVINFFSWNK